MFPFTITYKRRLNDINQSDKGKILSRLHQYVEIHKGQHISETDTKLSFRVNFWGWSWDKFVEIEKGVFTLTETILTFKVYMYRHFAVLVTMSLLIALWSRHLWVGIVVFLLLGFGSWLNALNKYRRLVNEVIKGINNLLDSKGSANNDISTIAAT